MKIHRYLDHYKSTITDVNMNISSKPLDVFKDSAKTITLEENCEVKLQFHTTEGMKQFLNDIQFLDKSYTSDNPTIKDFMSKLKSLDALTEE